MTTDTTLGTYPNTDIHVEAWGDGTSVVLAHGSLATAAEEWEVQRPLADEGYRLLAPDRRGYGRSPAADGEDFLRDAEDIATLMGNGAHLVGHSYGGLAVLFAAARRPEATRSLALLEPAAFALGGR
ncbi:MAG TPA: alpha/beta fold hydrolase [Actinomycetota bacterium]|nr:alpha/beta fold hydrolase [Actinomycetota bacterium]